MVFSVEQAAIIGYIQYRNGVAGRKCEVIDSCSTSMLYYPKCPRSSQEFLPRSPGARWTSFTRSSFPASNIKFGVLENIDTDCIGSLLRRTNHTGLETKYLFFCFFQLYR